MTTSQLLTGYLQAIREVQSMGISLSSQKGEDSGNFTHWAHSWLFDSEISPSRIVDIIPCSLLGCVPVDLHSVAYPRDLLGYLAMTAVHEIGEERDRRRKAVVHQVIPVSDAVQTLKSGHVRDSERLGLYERILGFESENHVLDDCCLHPVFLARFTEVVHGHRVCELQARKLAVRFFNRVVLHDFDETLFNLLRLVDRPLAERLTVEDLEPLWQSALACTLNDQDLRILWDLCLVSPPEFLVRVVVFSLVDLRDVILEHSVTDSVLTLGELIQDFNSIIALALANDGLG